MRAGSPAASVPALGFQERPSCTCARPGLQTHYKTQEVVRPSVPSVASSPLTPSESALRSSSSATMSFPRGWAGETPSPAPLTRLPSGLLASALILEGNGAAVLGVGADQRPQRRPRQTCACARGDTFTCSAGLLQIRPSAPAGCGAARHAVSPHSEEACTVRLSPRPGSPSQAPASSPNSPASRHPLHVLSFPGLFQTLGSSGCIRYSLIFNLAVPPQSPHGD